MIAHDDRVCGGAQQLLRDRRGRRAGRLLREERLQRVLRRAPDGDEAAARRRSQSFLETCWPPATRKSVIWRETRRTTRHAWRRLDSGFVSAIKFYRVRMGLSVRSDVAAGRGRGIFDS